MDTELSAKELYNTSAWERLSNDPPQTTFIESFVVAFLAYVMLVGVLSLVLFIAFKLIILIHS